MSSRGSVDGCWSKIARAKEHRDLLESHSKQTFSVEANRPRFGAKFEADTSEYVFYVNYMPDLTAAFDRASLILGDAVANLRSALDYLVFQLAIWNTNGNVRDERNVQFPITDKPEWFTKAAKKYLGEIHPDHIAVIERYQGYYRLHEEVSVGLYFHPLVMLRDLSDTDKHRLLTSVMVPSSAMSLEMGAAAIPILLFGSIQETMSGVRSLGTERVELNAELTRAKLPAGLLRNDLEMAGYVVGQIALTDGRPTVPVLDKVAAVVVKIVREFEPLF